MHINLLNFSQEHQRYCIINGLTFAAFLPVNFYTQHGCNLVQTAVSREKKLKMLHDALSYVLNEIKEVALEGFSCLDANHKKRRCHSCIALYTCDLPEGKDMTSVKNAHSSNRNRHRCVAKASDFNLSTFARNRSGHETKSVILEYFKIRSTTSLEQAKKVLNEYSLSPQVPWLLNFPFIGGHKLIDLHCLFGYEVLHNLHLGISNDLKRSLAERLKSTEHMTSSVPTVSGRKNEVTFKAIRSKVLGGENKMLAHMERTSPAQNSRINFSAGKDHSSGIYREDGTLVGRK